MNTDHVKNEQTDKPSGPLSTSDEAPDGTGVPRRRRRVRPQWTAEQLERSRQVRDCSASMIDTFADRQTAEELESLRTLQFVGEWHYMLNMLCLHLVVGKIPVTATERDALAEALRIFDSSDPSLPYLSSPDTTVAALTVVDG